jgi:hypothetical protein
MQGRAMRVEMPSGAIHKKKYGAEPWPGMANVWQSYIEKTDRSDMQGMSEGRMHGN